MTKAKSKRTTKRNKLGRTPTEQAAWDRLTDLMQKVLSGEVKASPTGYSVEPVNLGTGATFTGQNQRLAQFVAMFAGDNRFIGAHEAIKRGWSTKGAKGHPFSRPVTSTRENEEGEQEQRQFFKTYYLFNLGQIEHDLADEPVQGVELELQPFADQCLAAAASVARLTRNATSATQSEAKNKHGEMTAMCINIPPQAAFDTTKDLIAVTLHELGHNFGKGHEWYENYTTHRGAEELVADMCAMITMTHYGIEFSANNAAYIDSWLDSAKNSSPDPLVECFKEAGKRSEKIIETIDAVMASAKAA